jgi:hypothetical protein
LVNGDRAERHRCPGEDPAPDLLKIAARAQVHDRIGPIPDGDLDLPELAGELRKVGGGPDVDVDLGAEGLANPRRSGRGVIGVEGDDDLPLGNERKEVSRGYPLAPGHGFQGTGECSFAGVFKLGHIIEKYSVHPDT